MKLRAQNILLVPALAIGLGCMLTGRVNAQTFNVLHHFSATPFAYTNWDGAQPYHTGLLLAGNRLYGTAYFGGTNGRGTVFSIDVDGNNFAVLHTFTASQSPDFTNFDGEYPEGGLALSGDTLLGTALNGGTNSGGYGTVFSLNTNGSGFARLHSFDSVADGRNPHGPLVRSGNRLYGIAETGGAADHGTVFSISSIGTSFTVLHTFTNTDGVLPYAGLLLSGNTLYGTANYGGAFGNGTIFSVNTNGTDFSLPHAFTPMPGPFFTNVDGAYPEVALVLSDDTLYGTATAGGAYNGGTIFAIGTNGTGFRVLHSFAGGADGGYPLALSVSGGILYGTAEIGGDGGAGTIFSIKTDGTDFAILHAFSSLNSGANTDGASPEGALAVSGNALYGTTELGGAYGNGTVFCLLIQPQLSLTASGANVVLTWPTNAVGFTLQCTTNLASPAIWTTVSPSPAIVNGQNTVTNPVGGAQKFYRLSL